MPPRWLVNVLERVRHCGRGSAVDFTLKANEELLGLDLSAKAPLTFQSEHLLASRPVRLQVFGQPSRHLQGPLLDPTVPLVHLRGLVEAGRAPLGLEGGKGRPQARRRRL